MNFPTRRFFTRATLALTLLTGAAAAPMLASAQDQPSAERGDHHRSDRHHRGPGHMMRRALRQLDLTDNQQAQVRAIVDSSREQARELRAEGRNPETREQMRALFSETRRLIHEVLTPAQLQELEEMKARRVERRIERMTERLSLTPSQAEEVQGILTQAMGEDSRPRRGEVRSQLEAVLTPEQQALLPERGERRERRGRRGHR